MAIGRAIIVLLVLAASGPRPALAGEQALLDRCWTRQALAGTAGELKALRARTKLDLAALKQEPLPYISPVVQELRGSIRSVELPPGEMLIALTFDLCETDGDVAGYDGRIVDLLRAQGVKATFFASVPAPSSSPTPTAGAGTPRKHSRSLSPSSKRKATTS
jgi:hypothetical protein